MAGGVPGALSDQLVVVVAMRFARRKMSMQYQQMVLCKPSGLGPPALQRIWTLRVIDSTIPKRPRYPLSKLENDRFSCSVNAQVWHVYVVARPYDRMTADGRTHFSFRIQIS